MKISAAIIFLVFVVSMHLLFAISALNERHCGEILGVTYYDNEEDIQRGAEKLRRLVKKGINLNTLCVLPYGSDGDIEGTPLIINVKVHRPHAVQMLLDAGAKIDARGKDQETALMVTGNEEMAKILIKRGANPNSQDKFGRSPLMHALPSHLFELILNSGGRLHHKDKEGWTAWVYSDEFADGFLKSHGLNPTPTEKLLRILQKGGSGDGDYETALKDAATAIKEGANVNAKWHGTPLLFVAFSLGWFSHEEMLGLLISSGANVNIRFAGGDLFDEPNIYNSDLIGKNPLLIYAYIKGGKPNVSVVNKFIKAGVRINYKDAKGLTIFESQMYHPDQCSDNFRATIESLLGAGADVNTIDESGQTILQVVLDKCGYDGSFSRDIFKEKRLLKLVEVLLKAGVQVNHSTQSGLTALKIAKRNVTAISEIGLRYPLGMQPMPYHDELNGFKEDARNYYSGIVEILRAAGARE